MENNVSVVTDCGRQFVKNPSRQPVSQEKRDLIDKLLKERLAFMFYGVVTSPIAANIKSSLSF